MTLVLGPVALGIGLLGVWHGWFAFADLHRMKRA